MTCEVCNWKDECIETRRTLDGLELGKTVSIDNTLSMRILNNHFRADIIGMIRNGATVQQVSDRFAEIIAEVSE